MLFYIEEKSTDKPASLIMTIIKKQITPPLSRQGMIKTYKKNGDLVFLKIAQL